MKGRRYWFSIAFVCLLTLPGNAVALAQAEHYPDRPVTIISDSAAGSSPDVATRIVADELGKMWGWQVVLINRPGANGSIAARFANDTAADGYTLFTPSLSTFGRYRLWRRICRYSLAISCLSRLSANNRCSSP